MQALFLLSRICLIIRLPPFCCHSIVSWRRYVAGAKVLTMYSRTYKVEPCGLTKNLPCVLRLRGIFSQNLVRPNIYTIMPLKRNDRYDRKTHKKNVGSTSGRLRKETHSLNSQIRIKTKNQKQQRHENDNEDIRHIPVGRTLRDSEGNRLWRMATHL